MLNDVTDFYDYWNRNYPIDSWYRRKYNIPFGSRKHERTSFTYMKYMWMDSERQSIEEEKIRLVEDIKQCTGGTCKSIDEFIRLYHAKSNQNLKSIFAKDKYKLYKALMENISFLRDKADKVEEFYAQKRVDFQQKEMTRFVKRLKERGCTEEEINSLKQKHYERQMQHSSEKATK